MVDFATLAKKPGVTGIHDFKQKLKKTEYKFYLNTGICAGLVVYWLIAKKQQGFDSQDMFDSMLDVIQSESTSLLSNEHRYVSNSVSQQSAYDENTYDVNYLTLSKKGLYYSLADALERDDGGFGEHSLAIGEHIAATKSRFFILSMGGGGGHAIGIIRKSKKSVDYDEFRVFDPNFGEFEVQGAIGIHAILTWLKSMAYPNKYDGWYKVRPFRE